MSALAHTVGLKFVDQRMFLWREGYRSIPPDAELHPTVLERFALAGVLMHDQIRPYRPPALRDHGPVRGYWSPGEHVGDKSRLVRPAAVRFWDSSPTTRGRRT